MPTSAKSSRYSVFRRASVCAFFNVPDVKVLLVVKLWASFSEVGKHELLSCLSGVCRIPDPNRPGSGAAGEWTSSVWAFHTQRLKHCTTTTKNTTRVCAPSGSSLDALGSTKQHVTSSSSSSLITISCQLKSCTLYSSSEFCHGSF